MSEFNNRKTGAKKYRPRNYATNALDAIIHTNLLKYDVHSIWYKSNTKIIFNSSRKWLKISENIFDILNDVFLIWFGALY